MGGQLAERTGSVLRPWLRGSFVRTERMAPKTSEDPRSPQTAKPRLTRGFNSTSGGTRTTNLLIRRSPSPVHRRPQPSTQPETTGFRVHRRPHTSTAVHSEWLPTWLPRRERRPSCVTLQGPLDIGAQTPSTSPLSGERWAPPRARSTWRWSTPRKGTSSASRSSSTRRWASCWPTWRCRSVRSPPRMRRPRKGPTATTPTSIAAASSRRFASDVPMDVTTNAVQGLAAPGSRRSEPSCEKA